MATEIWVNLDSGNGLLPDGTKPLPEPVMAYHQRWSVVFTESNFILNDFKVIEAIVYCVKILFLDQPGKCFLGSLSSDAFINFLQSFNQKMRRGNNVSGKLLHLKRFFQERKPTYQRWLEDLTERLSNKPDKREVLTVIRSEMVSWWNSLIAPGRCIKNRLKLIIWLQFEFLSVTPIIWIHG